MVSCCLYSCVVWEYYFVIIGFPNTVKEKFLEIRHLYLIIKLVCCWVLLPGKTNPYFKNRIDAAEELFESGKIKYILISGDNRRHNYNEPQAMKDSLVNRGIPKESLVLDFAGLRTLDSMVRSKEIFGQDSVTVISQQFHNERAIYLARHYGIHAIGYNAKDVSAYEGLKTQIRELLARVKVFVDFFVNKQPRHLGEKIEIPE